MNLFLNNKKYTEKEVKRMKRICLLVIAAFFVIGGLKAFADDLPIVNTTQDTHKREETWFNDYGVAIGTITDFTTTTTTTAEDGTQTVTVNHQTVYAEWKSGSLKVVKIEGEVSTGGVGTTAENPVAASDGSYSHTDYCNIYDYENGVLVGVHGGLADGANAHTEGDRGLDDNGEPIGTFSQDTFDTYMIKNGEAVVTRSDSYGESFGVDGTQTGASHDITVNQYDILGGKVVITQSDTQQHSWDTDGQGNSLGAQGSETMIYQTTYYDRNQATGEMTGMRVVYDTANSYQRIVSDTQGTQTYKITHQQVDIAHSESQGFYIAHTIVDWDVVGGAGGGGGGGGGNSTGDPYLDRW